jgi:endonuclease/exonuclease/phosphatase family metal-dependent hydrolase
MTGDTGPLRVMTFNIRGFYHPNDGVNQWSNREALNIATIRRAAPHLIGMQEVQTGNLKAYARELTEYHWLAWPEYGNNKPFEWPAIYWDPRRLQPLDSGGFWLSETPEAWSRSWATDNIRACQWIRFRDRDSGAEFVHTNTHLDHVSKEARIQGSRLIIGRIGDENLAAAIIATGDYNDVPGSPTYRSWIEAGFVDAHVAAGCGDDPYESYTNHGWQGYPFARSDDTPQRIDWIMLRDSAATAITVRSCEIIRDGVPPVWPSDHFPVLAELKLSLAAWKSTDERHRA